MVRRCEVLQSLSGFMFGEHFPTSKPYHYDERYNRIVGCVYQFTPKYVEMHRFVVRSDQALRMLRLVNTEPNGDTGLYEKVNTDGKMVLYLDRECTDEW